MTGVESDIGLDEVAGLIRNHVKLNLRAPVMVAVPTRGMFESAWLDSYWRRMKPFEHPGDFWITASGTSIGEQRELIVKSFLDNTNYQWLVMMDDDVVYLGEGDPFAQMQQVAFDNQAHIVTAVTPLGFRPHHPNVYQYINSGEFPVEGDSHNRFVPVTEFSRDMVMEVDGVGGAFIMINRRVLEALPEPRFAFADYMSEDMYFCHQARQAGFKIIADFRIVVGHLRSMAMTLEHYLGVAAAEGMHEEFRARFAAKEAEKAANAKAGIFSPKIQEERHVPPKLVVVSH